jgi:hypothetical protein
VRRALAASACLLAFACSSEPSRTVAPTATVTPATPTPKPVPTADPGAFDVARAMGHVRALAVEIGLRNSGSPGDRLAADYIAAKAAALGWSVERQPFPLPQGGTSWNVIAKPPGFDENKPYLIVGGHYDSLRGPGANDNATGIAASLEIARAVDESPAGLPVAFVGFGAEEKQPLPGSWHHVGSRFYVAQMSEGARKNLVAFVNIDMIGVGDVVYCPRTSVGPREGTERCVATGANLNLRAFERVTPDWSDNGSFLRVGLNAAWLWTGDQRCCNHSPRDTIDRVQTASVERAGRLALALLRSYSR